MEDHVNQFALSLGFILGSLELEDFYTELIKIGCNAEELSQLRKATLKVSLKVADKLRGR